MRRTRHESSGTGIQGDGLAASGKWRIRAFTRGPRGSFGEIRPQDPFVHLVPLPWSGGKTPGAANFRDAAPCGRYMRNPHAAPVAGPNPMVAANSGISNTRPFVGSDRF